MQSTIFSRKIAKRNQRKRERSQEAGEQFEKRPKLKSKDTASGPGDSENKTRNDPGKLPDSDPQPYCSSTTEDISKLKMRVNLIAFARECDRYGVSDRSAASLSFALLQDLGIINEQDTSEIIDRNKVRREREKHRKELQNKNMEVVKALYFDGRKDKSLTHTKKGDKYYYSTITEEHISSVKKQGSIYFGHLAVSSGSAVVIKDAILNFFNKKEISIESLIGVICDGTNVNTGTNEEIIKLLEIALNRPLQ
ncbi:unnamed protein product [Psylliodes chrysocephalus]|uniref:Uncharacterized protein n=1 Tax=Psylliodes chrysocephalus TaxID=3402493 RepID=A0A9P0CWW6_9CUCU|nr:unnamed protein product [Psylliodes chrysocephala]